ncbi:MAG: GNAT family N-acetyltransferase [Clostridium sp.]|uniref:GNAT family N-acetyltransferase n=1 Tax=Clostridium sp. TaxID=1506 RepID=UPI002A75AD57|nr:GNAT family N-acetyltransferase [Clostridium sp.]MDY2630353.1 GNAT family N-acetyltransferase [Clostridium sp.]
MGELKEINLKNGQSLILRKPNVNDAEKIIEYLNIVGGESDNLLFGKNEFHLSVEQEREYIKNLNNSKDAFMVMGIINNKVVSIAQIRKLGRKRIEHNSEIAISVKKEYWGLGIGSAVMSELIEFARNNDIRNIELGVKASNSKAIKLYEKFGFEKVGCHKNYFNVNGVFDDEILMDLSLN